MSMFNSQDELRHEKLLPSGWRWARLGEACEQDRRIVEPGSGVAATLPYLSLEHVESTSGRILREAAKPVQDEARSTTFAFDSRHVLYGKLRPYLNKVALPEFSGRCTTEIIPLLPCAGTDRCYLAWLLRRDETVSAAMRQRTGSRMPRADMDDLLSLKIPLPPLEEQKRIAAILNEQMGKVERARAAAETQLEAAKALPAAYLRPVFSSPEARQWPRKPLRQLCGDIYRYPSFYGMEHLSAGVPVVRGEHINEMGEITTDWTSYWHISQLVSDKFPRTVLQEGDLVYTVRGTIGKIGIVRSAHRGAQLSPNLIRISPLQVVCSVYLWHYFRSIKGTKEAVVDNAVTVATVKASDLGRIEIPVPPFSGQQRIAAMLNEQMAATERAREAIEEELDAINKLPAVLLRRAFAGEL